MSKDDHPNCRDYADKMTDLIDGALEGDELSEMIERLEDGPCCKECLKEFQTTRELLKKVPPLELPPDVKERLKACLKKPHKS